MSDAVLQSLDRLFAAYRAGGTLTLLFDYDGTLTPIVAHPRLAVLAPETRELLQRLASLPRVFVGVLSGRSLDDLMGMVGLPSLWYVGTSGLEYDAGDVKFTHGVSPAARDLLATASNRLKELERSYAGVWLELKPLALTLHYRNAADHCLSELRERTVSLLATFDGELRVTDGPMAFEITPELGWSKGTAVHCLCTQSGSDVIPVYAGDHDNDAEALAAVAALGGVTFSVGIHAPSTAHHRLADPAALISLLAQMLDRLTLATRETCNPATFATAEP